MRTLFVLMAIVVLGCGSGVETCEPQCSGRACGDDGCGGSCGVCEGNTLCVEGSCTECIPDCAGLECGPDGCGGECGACPIDKVCHRASLTCVPAPANCEAVCTEGEAPCGPDGCGHTCGDCEDPLVCSQSELSCSLPCIPDCGDFECGDDGCGGSCGECEAPSFCDLGACIASDVLPQESFTIGFTYTGRITGVNDNERDMLMVNPDGSVPMKMGSTEPLSLTDFTLSQAESCRMELEPGVESPCSCKLGCLLHPKRSWMAVATAPANLEGMTWSLGALDDSLALTMFDQAPLTGVIDYSFGGDYFYFSRRAGCRSESCQYSIYRVDLTKASQPQELLVFPPSEDPDWPDHTNFQGHFSVSGDGSTLVLLSSTIRSLRIYVWKDGALSEQELLCSNWRDGLCVGAGSEFSDDEPVGISDDGELVALVTTAERELKIRVYNTVTGEIRSQTLFSVPSGNYLTSICPNIATESWKFRSILKRPVFTKDKKSLLLLVNDDCTMGGGDIKPETDLVLLDLASIGDGSEFLERDMKSITRNPKDSGVNNLVITDFALSPGGKVVVFTATPAYDHGELMDDGSKRSMRDKELWVVGLNQAGLTQLTDNISFEAMAPVPVLSEGLPY